MAGWGGKRDGAGRKPGSTVARKEATRSAWVSFRCTEEEKRRLNELAESHGMSLTEYILWRALGAENGEEAAKSGAARSSSLPRYST